MFAAADCSIPLPVSTRGAGLPRFRWRSARRPDPRGIAPKPLQIVPLAEIAPHDVDDDVEEVEDDPAGVEVSVNCPCPDPVIGVELFGDLVDDGAQVRLTRSGREHKVISDAADRSDVQDHDVFRLPVIRQLAAEERQFLRVHFGRRWDTGD